MIKKKQKYDPNLRMRDGAELPDPTPVSIPLKFQREESSEARMRRMIKQEMSAVADDAGWETEEEANDFDIEDEQVEDFISIWENEFDPELEPQDDNSGMIQEEPIEAKDTPEEANPPPQEETTAG